MEFYFAEALAQACDFDDIVNQLVFNAQEDVLNRIQCYQSLEPSEIMSDNVFEQTDFDQADGHGDKDGYRIDSPVSAVSSEVYWGSHLSYEHNSTKDSASLAESILSQVHSIDYLSATSIENSQPDHDIERPSPEASTIENSSPTPERDIGDFAIYGTPRLISRNAKLDLGASTATPRGAREGQVGTERRQQPRRRVRSLVLCSAYNMGEHMGVKVPKKSKTSRSRRSSEFAKRRVT